MVINYLNMLLSINLTSSSEKVLLVPLGEEHLRVQLRTAETLGVELGGTVGPLVPEGIEASF